jgi:ABC-type transport system involved in cytochrome c biogenesis permease subunit
MLQLVLTLAAVVLTVSPPAEAKLPATLDLARIRALPVQHDGRWPPLDTAARDIVESVTGSAFYRGQDPVLLLLAWTFDSETWQRQPLITIANAQLRQELQLPQFKTVFSYNELANHPRFLALVDELARTGADRKLNPLESKVADIHKKLLTLQQVFGGGAIRPIPDPDSVNGTWRPIAPATLEHAHATDDVTTAWAALREAFLDDDGPAFAAATEQLVAALEALPAAYRPTPRLIATELRYNKLQPFRLSWMVMVVGAVLAALAMLVRRKWFDALTIVALLAGFGILTYGLSLRWQIAGRIPAANMFESLLFLSWGAGAFAILSPIVLRHRLVPLTASAMGALALILADRLPLDHYVRPIVPVLLDTIWMSIHVPIIMISYAVLALAVVIAHVQLVLMAAAPRRRDLANSIDALHYWYVHIGALLLLAGIITGSMWAASSWGRYWGWDPKEVWSLIAFLGYLTILHVRANHEKVPRWAYAVAATLGVALFALIIPKLAPLTGPKLLAFAGTAAAMAIFVVARGQFATALKSVLAFWLIVMTYVGVNYVLGMGLHSYGFGTGAVVHYMFLVGGIDLTLIAVCCAVYLARPDRQPLPAPAIADKTMV